jgi:protein-S-isoprenylcysteine O-methyltransferase Ste14
MEKLASDLILWFYTEGGSLYLIVPGIGFVCFGLYSLRKGAIYSKHAVMFSRRTDPYGFFLAVGVDLFIGLAVLLMGIKEIFAPGLTIPDVWKVSFLCVLIALLAAMAYFGWRANRRTFIK